MRNNLAAFLLLLLTACGGGGGGSQSTSGNAGTDTGFNQSGEAGNQTRLEFASYDSAAFEVAAFVAEPEVIISDVNTYQ